MSASEWSDPLAWPVGDGNQPPWLACGPLAGQGNRDRCYGDILCRLFMKNVCRFNL